jgi:hypothetical protein
MNEKTSDHYVNSFVRGLGDDITQAGRLTERGAVVGGGYAWALVSDIKATVTGGLAGQSRDGDLMTRTIDAECVVRGPYDMDALTRKARQAVEMQRGKFVAALGRIESVTVQRVRPDRGHSPAARRSDRSPHHHREQGCLTGRPEGRSLRAPSLCLWISDEERGALARGCPRMRRTCASYATRGAGRRTTAP